MELDAETLRLLQETFNNELDDQCQILSEGLLQLEKGAQEKQYGELLNTMFRAAHTIKGAARGMDVSDVGTLAHRLESLFGVLRSGELDLAEGMIDLCLETLDGMRRALDAYNANQAVDFDLQNLLDRLQAAAEGHMQTPAATKPAATVSTSVETDESRDNAPADTRNTEPAAGQETSPSPLSPQAPGGIRVSLEKLERVGGWVEELQLVKIQQEDQLSDLQGLQYRVRQLNAQWRKAQPTLRQLGAKQAPGLDNQLSTVHDLIAEIDQQLRWLNTGQKNNIKHLNTVSGALQGDMHTLRMVPVSSLLRPLARSVRDIAKELGKQVEFEIIGEGIEMDRSVLEGIKAPLMHLFRNAIDHGIESPDKRSAAGKPEFGRLTVAVEGHGSRIHMRVSDDGAGIDPRRILETARRKQLLGAAELDNMSEDELLELIFRPGFSSKEIITDISGRGVGLDVVHANLRQLKGNVSLETDPGQGATFILSLPLTLATDRGLLVKCGGTLYAVPITSVERVMEIAHDALLEVEAGQAVRLGERAVPLRELAEILGVERHEQPKLLPIVVLSKGWETVAFLVDEVVGEREIVVKRFTPPLVAVRNVTGGSLTGGGEVIMVLNPMDLVDSALRPGVSARVVSGKDEDAQQVPRILVADDSITTRTLEKNILEGAGYRVEVAVDGIQAWDLLQQQSFDLVVTDVEMPGLDGFALTQRIKDSERFHETPVVVVTSLAREEDRQRGIEVGANAYIMKGQFETRALLEVVGQLV